MDQRLQDPAGAAPPDWRGLCEELVRELECWRPLTEVPDCLARARAALAQPEPEVVGPTNEELLKLMPEQFREDLATVSRMAAHGAGTGVTPGLFRVSLNTGALEYARAVLARWGRPAPAPAEGEVAELVEWLRNMANADLGGIDELNADRAADLLQRHPAPVPVSERLAGAGDCDGEGRCWFWRTDGADEFWELVVPLSNIHEFNLTAQWKYTHWLPATALPLPSGEVQP